jgi:hypothetical protein
MNTQPLFDPNTLLIPLAVLAGVLFAVSGIFLAVRSFFRFRFALNQSLSMDLEVIKISKIHKKKEEQTKPDEWREEIGSMEQFLGSLAHIKGDLSWIQKVLYHAPQIVFEIANPSTSEEILFFIAVPKKFRESIEKQVHSFFPNASIEKITDYTIFSPKSFTAVSTLQLKHTYALPLTTYRTLSIDPLNEISNSLSKLDTIEEGAVIQLVLVPAGVEWQKLGKKIAHKMQQGKQLKDAHRSLASEIGTELSKAIFSSKSQSEIEEKKIIQLTPEEQELVKSIDAKASKSGFLVNVRLVSSAASQSRADEIVGHLENAFSQFENHGVNHFQVKHRKSGRILRETVYDYIFRNFDEDDAMILTTEEIASLFHLPISTTETPKIKWLKSGAAAPPVNVPKDGLLLGFNEYRGSKTDIRITESDRRRHMYVIGQTGVGKSVFLQEMAKKDAASGKGFCFIDPHGDAIEDILQSIPKERADDVIIFDPSDTERPFGLNLLEYDSKHPEQKTFVINEMIGIFDQLYDLKATGGPMFEQYMRNAMLLIMEHPESGSTLMEISKVLADEDFRKMKLSHCSNPIVIDFWTKEAEKAGGEAALANMVPYITSKLTTFTSNDMMRPIIAQQHSTVNFRQAMDEGKIILVNLSKGKLGEINARLLGMVIVGKILMGALSRVDIPEDDRRDFYLYLDEFQNVTTNSIAQILSEARKYRLVLTVAHQFIGQLKEDISKAVFGNVGSLVAFRVGPEDADFLEKQFAPIFSAQDLMNVDNRQCFARLLMNNELTRPFNMKTFPPLKGNRDLAQCFKELSRLRYGRASILVNQEILDRDRLG